MGNFNNVPMVRFNRSKFTPSHTTKTSMNVGTLYPISCVEVLPGDSWKSKVSAVARVTSSFLKPVMDNAVLDIFHFFVPLRLVYDDAEKVFGNASPSAYIDEELAEIPTIADITEITRGSVGDYLGLPVSVPMPAGASILPFRAFALIYNKWFRDENVTDEVYIQKGAFNVSEQPNARPWSADNYTGMPPKVSKRKDYFTSCLPRTQKGKAVQVPLGATAPVNYVGGSNTLIRDTQGNLLNDVGVYSNNSEFSGAKFTTNTGAFLGLVNGSASGIGLDNSSALSVDLSQATASNVNDLRLAFQLQKMLERDALYGSRYNEYLLAHFGVSSPDSRLQNPEYLGGGTIPIHAQQVAQTSASTEDSPLADVGAYSLTNGYSSFSKGIVEHGYIITCACIRILHSYQQGVQKMWFRKKRNDFYDPLFANLGEQPVYYDEIYAVATGSDDTLGADGVFGYNEAWASYRSLPNSITGQMRSNSLSGLDVWHFADKYSSRPVLSSAFIEENSSSFDRTLSAPSSSIDNFICDFYFKNEAIRVMPTFSVPGLIDHH